jgi:hypothetical protein
MRLRIFINVPGVDEPRVFELQVPASASDVEIQAAVTRAAASFGRTFRNSLRWAQRPGARPAQRTRCPLTTLDRAASANVGARAPS